MAAADAPNDLRYLQTHEWHRLEGDTVTIGITQIAADELTDITFVDLPKVGATLTANGRFGEIESVKATSDLYSGMSGTVSEVNAALSNEPGLVNRDPYKGGWMIKVKASAPAEFEKLLAADEYLKQSGH
jgi:glycine cleavage system H protein